MKHFLSLLVSLSLFAPCVLFAQANDAKLESDFINSQGKELDKQIVEINKKISDVMKKYDLINTKDIRIVPFETTYNIGPDYIELEKHSFIRDDLLKAEIVGIKKNKVKLFVSGGALSKIDIEISENSFYSGTSEYVRIVNASPLAENTDGITFTHFVRGQKIIENRKLSDFKNSTAFPVRNEMKRNFIVPHMTVVYNSLLFIAEAYNKSLKDSETITSEFLKRTWDE